MLDMAEKKKREAQALEKRHCAQIKEMQSVLSKQIKLKEMFEDKLKDVMME